VTHRIWQYRRFAKERNRLAMSGRNPGDLAMVNIKEELNEIVTKILSVMQEMNG
jgi:hypothetical protein